MGDRAPLASLSALGGEPALMYARVGGQALLVLLQQEVQVAGALVRGERGRRKLMRGRSHVPSQRGLCVQ